MKTGAGEVYTLQTGINVVRLIKTPEIAKAMPPVFRRAPIFLAFTLLTAASADVAWAKTGPIKGLKEKVWVIEQENAQLGKLTVYASQNALRVKVGRTGGNLVARAPDWKVVFYNTEDLVYYEAPYDRFQRQELPALIATTDYFEGRKLNPQPVNYSGVRALRVSAPTPEGSTVGMMMPSYSGVGNESAPSKSKAVVVIATEAIPVPAKSIAILKAIYRVPRFGGFPLGVFFQHKNNSSGVTLKTYSIKEEERSSSLFNYSVKGYKLAKTAETVVLSGMLESAFSLTP
jgi:hypothetical protein